MITTTYPDAIIDFYLASWCFEIVKSFEELPRIEVYSHINVMLEMVAMLWAIQKFIDPFDLKEVKGILVFALKTFIH